MDKCVLTLTQIMIYCPSPRRNFALSKDMAFLDKHRMVVNNTQSPLVNSVYFHLIFLVVAVVEACTSTLFQFQLQILRYTYYTGDTN